MKRLLSILIIFTFIFTSLPLAAGTLSADAASRPASLKNLKASNPTQNSVMLTWNRITNKSQLNNMSGIAIYRNGKLVKNVAKNSRAYRVYGCAAGTKYKFQIRSYRTVWKYQHQWIDKRTKKWTAKKPPAKYRGKYRKAKVKTFVYGYVSSVYGTTKAAPKPTPTIPTAPTTTTPTPTVPTTPSSGNTSGGNGTSGGGTAPQPAVRTEYNCVDYLGESHTFWKDENGKIYDSQTGGSVISNIAMYDKTVDGSWTSNNNSTWKKSGSFYQKNGITFRCDGSDIYIFNGNINKAKLEVVEETQSFKIGYRNSDTGPISYFDANCIMIGEDRLTIFEIRKKLSDGVDSVLFFSGTDTMANKIYGTDGYIDGTVHLNKYYDFNGDGTWTADEKFATGTQYIASKKRTVKALEIAKAAIKDYEDNPDDYAEITAYNLNDYQRDIRIIQQYFESHYKYSNGDIDGSGLTARCNGGANVLKAWSAYKYHVYGFVDCAPGGDDHVAFYPGIDGVNKSDITGVSREDTYYSCQGGY